LAQAWLTFLEIYEEVDCAFAGVYFYHFAGPLDAVGSRFEVHNVKSPLMAIGQHTKDRNGAEIRFEIKVVSPLQG